MSEKYHEWQEKLDKLKCMGFKLPDNVLIRHLKECEGNIVSVVEKLLKQMKNIKIKRKHQALPPMVSELDKNYECWLYPILIIIVIPVLLSIFTQFIHHDIGDDVVSSNDEFLDFGIYDILWMTDDGISNHFQTNNVSLALRKYHQYQYKYDVYFHQIGFGRHPFSENMMNFIIDQGFMFENETKLAFHAMRSGTDNNKKQNEIYIEYGNNDTMFIIPRWSVHSSLILTKYNGKINKYSIADIDTFFDFIIAAKQKNVLIDISNLIFISYMNINKSINNKRFETKVTEINDIYYLPYIKSKIGGNIIDSDLNGLDYNEKIEFFKYWLDLEKRLQRIQDNNNNNNNDILIWLETELLNDKQIDNVKVNLFMYYLYFFRDIQDSFDLVKFRELLLLKKDKNKDERERNEILNEFEKEMRFQNQNEMNIFIKNIIIYLYELPSWIVGKYKCHKYDDDIIHHNDYHYVQILHDRTNIGNYIWKTRIGQIWSLLKIDDDLLSFNIDKQCIYYNYDGYTNMTFKMDQNTHKIQAAIGQYWEEYDKESEL